MRMNNVQMNDEMMKQVCGGFWWPSTYPDAVYQAMGISVISNFLSKDEFIMPDGSVKTMAEADAYAKENYNIINCADSQNIYYVITEKGTGKVIFGDPYYINHYCDISNCI